MTWRVGGIGPRGRATRRAARGGRARRALALAGALGAGGCSFLGLDEFVVPFCTSHEECEVINRADGVPRDACERWQCSGVQVLGEEVGVLSRGQCVLRPPDLDGDGAVAARCGGDDCDDAEPRAFESSPEACDGVDNDCDGTIDEPAAGDAASRPLAVAGAALARALEGDGVAWSNADPAVAATVPADGPARLAVAAGGGAALRAAWRWADGPRTAAWLDGCPVPTPEGTAQTSCEIAAMALADAGPLTVALAVNTLGCGRGQLRVGTLRRDDPGTISQRGPTRRSPVWRGVDVDPLAAPRCTGVAGARAPALAPFGDDEAPEAPRRLLALWLDASAAGREACGDPVPVRALGLFPRTGGAGTSIDWVDATDAGVPAILGESVGRTAPAWAPWVDGAVLVAWPVAEQTIQLALVPDPGAHAGDPAFGCAADDTCESREGVPETPLPAPIELTRLPAMGPGLAEVALALGPLDGAAGRQSVGVAWRTACGAATGIGFRRVGVVLGEGGVEPGDPGQLREIAGSDDDVARGPALIYLPDGFTIERNVDPPREGGGWLVLWQTSTGAIRGRRVGEDGDLLPDDGIWETTGDRFRWPPGAGTAPGDARVVDEGGDLVPLALDCR